MDGYKSIVKALSKKLRKDRDETKWEDGSENLDYIMNIRLQQDIIDVIVDDGLASYSEAASVASKVAKRYLDGLINLANFD